MIFRASVVTLYPQMFPGPLGFSLAGNALSRGDWSLETIPLREFGEGKHKRVDDTPAGGGPGMVLRADVLADAIDSLEADNRPRLLMSPRGKPLTQKFVHDLAASDGVVIVCGRFEGVDQRVIDGRNLIEVSIGDYILSGGEPAAITLLDSVVRLLPGVMGNATSGTQESFENGLLEHPQFTRPQVWEGQNIPDVLTSGNHRRISDWQQEEAKKLTTERRPDLISHRPGTAVEIMPALPVNDLKEGIAFYCDKLGFNCVHQDEGGYAVLQLDKVELHLWLANDKSWENRETGDPILTGAETFLAGTHSCRIEVFNVKALFEKLSQKRGLLGADATVEKREWGSTEFAVKDPYGNLVIFHEWL